MRTAKAEISWLRAHADSVGPDQTTKAKKWSSHPCRPPGYKTFFMLSYVQQERIWNLFEIY